MGEPREIDAPFFGRRSSVARNSFRSMNSQQFKENIFEGRPSIGSINFLFTPKERLSSQTSSDKLGSFDLGKRNSSMSDASLKRLSTLELQKTPLPVIPSKKKVNGINALFDKSPDQFLLDKKEMLKAKEIPRVQKKISSRRKRSDDKHCQCKLSKCLKLYCACFSQQKSCSESCQCSGCYNTEELTELREMVYKDTTEKNPLAFKNKFKDIQGADKKLHARGCNCTKTRCQKNYCECYSAGTGCSPICKCSNCLNTRVKINENEVKVYYEKVLRKRRKKKTVSEEVLQKYSSLAKN